MQGDPAQGDRPGGEPILTAARPNRFNRGNCHQWKRCLGETIGNMPVPSPEYCGPLGGKSWRAPDGRCVDLLDPPWETAPGQTPPGR